MVQKLVFLTNHLGLPWYLSGLFHWATYMCIGYMAIRQHRSEVQINGVQARSWLVHAGYQRILRD